MGGGMVWGGWPNALAWQLPLLHAVVLALCLFATAWQGGTATGLDLLQVRSLPADRLILQREARRYWFPGLAWLFLALTVLLAAFPVGMGVLLPQVRWPITIMLGGLLLRAICTLTSPAASSSRAESWSSRGLAGAGLLTTLGQGYILGVVMAGYRDATAYQVLSSMIAVCVVAGSLSFGAARALMLNTSAALRRRCARLTRACSWLLAAGIAAGSVTVPLTSLTVLQRWLAPATLIYVAVLPATLLVCFATLEFTLRRFDQAASPSRLPFTLLLVILAGVFAGVAYSLFPFFIPDRLTIHEAAASAEALRMLTPGVVATTLLLLGATVAGARHGHQWAP